MILFLMIYLSIFNVVVVVFPLSVASKDLMAVGNK